MNPLPRQIHVITGKLAAGAVREELAKLEKKLGLQATVQVLPITVAALLTTHWIAPRLEIPPGTELLLLPGYTLGEVEAIAAVTKIPVVWGPKDIRDLEAFFTGVARGPEDLVAWDIEIVAEINHAPRLPREELIRQALKLRDAGADVIDVGCLPDQEWSGVGEAVSDLRDLGLRVSVDSFRVREIQWATAAGAELVLSVNSSNVAAAADWGAEVVVVPDEPENWQAIEDTMEQLSAAGVPFRIDPILEPLGLGFAASLQRYFAARAKWPQVPMLMGIGNVTELADVDSAGVNMLLLGICQELGIHSVLTTQVANWCQGSVRECAVARRLVKFANDKRLPPKRLSPELLQLRDPKVWPWSVDELESLARQIKDRNYRIAVSQSKIHVIGLEDHFSGNDPFAVFEEAWAAHPRNLDPSHAFYLGFELCKAELALQLGKRYVQDEPLQWGWATELFGRHHRVRQRSRPTSSSENQPPSESADNAEPT